MEEKVQVIEALRQVIEQKQVDKLSEFEHPHSWEGLRKHEKRALGKLFFERGKRLYKLDDPEGLRSLKIAADLLVDMAETWRYLAKAYLKFHKGVDDLEEGLKAVYRAYHLDPLFFEVNLQMTHLLTEFGMLTQSLETLGDAERIFNELYLHQQTKILDPNFFWYWGVTCHHLGKLSGEPTDYRKAIEIYKMGVAAEEKDYRLYRDYGLALLEQGSLLNQTDCFSQAVPIFEKALDLDPESHEVWQATARLKHILFDFTGEFSYAHEALFAYSRADRLVAIDPATLFQWGDLLVILGKYEENVAFIEEAFMKFERIKDTDCSQDLPYDKVLRIWAEAELLASDISKGDLKLIRQAEEHIKASLQLAPKNPHAWLTYGGCLNELGRYFSDDSFYLQAIEKFRTGISLEENSPLLWYGLALSHFVIGETRGDIHMLKKAAAYCARLMEFGGEMFPQFWNDWAVVLLKIGEHTRDIKVLMAAKEKFEHAIVLFQKKHELSKINPNCLNHYGSCLDLLGEIEGSLSFYEGAVEVLWQAMLLDAECVDIRYNYAFALIHLAESTSDLDMYSQAIDQFRFLVEHDPEDEMAWNDWGATLMKMADHADDSAFIYQGDELRDEAKEKLLQAASLGYAPSYYNLACYYAMRGDVSTTLLYLKKGEDTEALPCMDDLLHDPWLENVHGTLEFRLFIDRYTL